MNRCGVTLVELLVTIVIGSIAMLALTVPFNTERIFWVSGKRQTEAQRDAQMALRAIARVARQGSAYALNAPGDITVTAACGTSRFQGGPAFNDQLLLSGTCMAQPVTLIDGNRSRVVNFTLTAVSSKLVQLQVAIAQGQQTESLITELFLRNAS